ncbi:hypothetical protein BKA93DRAFT_31339 [Sparassis latifolia]
MTNHIVEIGLEDFMAEFVPGPDPSYEERSKFQSFECVKLDGLETDMYPGLCKVFQSVLNAVPQSGLTARDTGEYLDVTGSEVASDENITKFGIGIYPTTAAAKEAYSVPTKQLMRGKSAQRQKYYMARVSWAWTCVPIEAKSNHQRSAFEFNDPGITEHAAQILLRQHRLFCLMVFICKSGARLIRWDRAGGIVSKSFDYIQEPETLHTFMYRVGKMNDSQRGYDPTAILATPEEVAEMRSCESRLNEYHKECLREAMLDGWPIYKIEFKADDVLSETGKTVSPPSTLKRHYLVGRARSSSSSLTGRATRGYVAYDMATQRLAFLKDTWRADSDKVKPEREVYERLYQKGVRERIATLICGGDVGESVQKTRTQEFNARIMGRIHYRIVVKDVGRPLEDYADVREMILVVRDAVIAHRDAWVSAAILHCDVSANNILISQDPDAEGYLTGTLSPAGFLNDWDMCKYKEHLDKGASQNTRSGTWQFMSALLLRYPTVKGHEVSDDMESFVHLVHWLALKYHPHDLSGSPLRTHIESTYNECDRTLAGHYVGGTYKFSTIKAGLVPFDVSGNPALSNLLRSLIELCRRHYAAIDIDALGPIHGATTTTPSAPVTFRTELPPGFDIVTPAALIPRPSDGQLLLADHHAVYVAFTAVVRDNGPFWVRDKVENKFKPFTKGKSLQESFQTGTSVGSEGKADDFTEDSAKRQKTQGSKSGACSSRSRATGSLGLNASQLDSMDEGQDSED